jgi:CheY-like chemotaxis protein
MDSAQSRQNVVLVVDDDPMLCDILAQALADEGYPVLTAANGEEALAIASTLDGQLALVVTDILLHEMDGLDLAARLASLKTPPAVLFISGVAAGRDLPGPVLRKPFGPLAFLQQVARMLPKVRHQ